MSAVSPGYLEALSKIFIVSYDIDFALIQLVGLHFISKADYARLQVSLAALHVLNYRSKTLYCRMSLISFSACSTVIPPVEHIKIRSKEVQGVTSCLQQRRIALYADKFQHMILNVQWCSMTLWGHSLVHFFPEMMDKLSLCADDRSHRQLWFNEDNLKRLR